MMETIKAIEAIKEVKDLRAYSKEPTTHEDFLFSTRITKQDGAEFFLRRGNPPTIKDTVEDWEYSWWYGIIPKKPFVRTIMEEVNWRLGSGFGNASLVSMVDIPYLYEQKKQEMGFEVGYD